MYRSPLDIPVCILPPSTVPSTVIDIWLMYSTALPFWKGRCGFAVLRRYGTLSPVSWPLHTPETNWITDVWKIGQTLPQLELRVIVLICTGKGTCMRLLARTHTHTQGIRTYIQYWLRSGQTGDRTPAGPEFPPVQTGPGAHPASCTMGTGSFPGVKHARGVLLTTHPLLVPWSWKSRAIPLPTLWATTGPVTGTLYIYTEGSRLTTGLHSQILGCKSNRRKTSII